MKNYDHLGGGNGMFFEIHTTKNVGGFSPLCVSGLHIFLKRSSSILNIHEKKLKLEFKDKNFLTWNFHLYTTGFLSNYDQITQVKPHQQLCES